MVMEDGEVQMGGGDEASTPEGREDKGPEDQGRAEEEEQRWYLCAGGALREGGQQGPHWSDSPQGRQLTCGGAEPHLPDEEPYCGRLSSAGWTQQDLRPGPGHVTSAGCR